MRTRRNQRKNKLSARRAAHTQHAAGHERLVASTLAGMALLAISPASHSLSLGEVTVHSSLGQRLDASVPVQLGAGESLISGCIQSVRSTNELGRVTDALLSTPEAAGPGMYTVRISSTAALYEPIYALSLQASCPGTATVTREYDLMLDLPGTTVEQLPVPLQAPVTQPERRPEVLPVSLASGDALRTPAPRQQALRPRRVLDAVGTPILPGTRYQVVSGDTVSSIAARVSGRKVNLWTLAGQLFAANPAAFIRNDINLIKLGSTITIPTADYTVGTATGAELTVATPDPVPLPLPAPVLATTAAALRAEPEVVAATTEVAATPTAEVAPVSRIAPITEAAARPSGPAAVDVPAETEASPLAAAAAGITFGLLISALLWFRNRLPAVARKRPAKQPAKPAKAVEDLPLPVAVAPIAVRTERAEPSITVQWSARPEDPLAAEFATAAPAVHSPVSRTPAAHSDEITSELEKLFGDDSETMNTPAMSSMPDDVDTADMDDNKAETLLQALSLLERDYEADLTASQVLDLSTMREALATGTDSRPYIKQPD